MRWRTPGLWLAGLSFLFAACGSPPPVATSSPTTGAGPEGLTGPTTSVPPRRFSTTTTTVVPRPSRFVAQSASFVTANDGFVLGEAPCPAGACLAVRHTFDRGRTWTDLNAPATTIPAVGTDPTGSWASGLHFADRLDGWVYGSALWATHDGAGSWRQIDLGGPVIALASGSGVAFALVQTCQSCADAQGAVRLFRSADDRDAWAEVPGVALGESAPGLVAEGATVFVTSQSPPVLLVSSDGLHFAPLAIPCQPMANDPAAPFLIGSIAASDPTDLAVACAGEPAAGSEMKELFVSHDGGRSFERLPDPPFGGGEGTLAMPSPTTVLLSAESGASEVYRLGWPDATWTTPIVIGDGGYGLNGVAFVDPSDGSVVHGSAGAALGALSFGQSAVGFGDLYLTDDGGAAWFLVNVPG